MQTISKPDSIYKVGMNNKAARKEMRLAEQRLKKVEAKLLVEVTADKLTNSMNAICPITGIINKLDMPAFPGFYMDAHHPIVYNVRNILRQPSYYKQLTPEYKAGLILAALDHFKLLELKSAAVAINLAMVMTIDADLLSNIIKFIADSAACTAKAYPIISLSAENVSAEKFQHWLNICDEVEHFNYTPTLTVEQAIDARLFTVPKLIKTDKQLAIYDKSCYEDYLELIELDILPADLIKKAKPFVKNLVSATAEVTIQRLLIAISDKYQVNDLADASFEEQHAMVAEFIEKVKAKRESAMRLGAYATESLDDLEAPSEPKPVNVSDALDSLDAVEVKPVESSGFAAKLLAMKGNSPAKPNLVPQEKKVSPFEAKLLAMKAAKENGNAN